MNLIVANLTIVYAILIDANLIVLVKKKQPLQPLQHFQDAQIYVQITIRLDALLDQTPAGIFHIVTAVVAITTV